MIKHIVFWKFLDETKEGSRQQNLKKAESLLLALKDKIKGIIDLRTGINMQPDACSSHLALIITFSDKESLRHYQNHPAHLEVKEFLSNVRYERRVVDYEI